MNLQGLNPILTRTGQFTGVLSGVVVCFLALPMAYRLFEQESDLGPAVAFSALGIFGIGAATAALYRRPLILLAIGVVSFMPAGLYLLGANNEAVWIGAGTLGYLVAAGFLWVGRAIQAA